MFLEYPYLNILSHRDLRSLFLCVSVSQDIQGNVYILLNLHRLHVFLPDAQLPPLPYHILFE